MRRAMLAGTALMAMSGAARAVDLGIPIDIFAQEFNARAKALSRPATATAPVCVERTACYSALGGGVALLTGTALDSDMVREAELVSSSSPAGSLVFSDATVVLVGLLSPELSEAERRVLLTGMEADASAQTPGTRSGREKVCYDIAVQEDGRLVFTAKR